MTGLSFGNSFYSITFPQKDHFPEFGARYQFQLEDAIDNCDEFLIHPTVLEKSNLFLAHSDIPYLD